MRIDAIMRKRPNLDRLALLAFLVVFITVLVRTAWLCDDAYITLRTVDNFIHGYGLTWNPGERVQSYTHPLWMFLLSGVYALSREDYYTTLGLSLFFSITAILLVAFGWTKKALIASAGLAILTFSRAFVDYSTSGLENPLTHFLLALFLILYWRTPEWPQRRNLLAIALTASLCALNRLDVLLFFLPPLMDLYLRVLTKRPSQEPGVGFMKNLWCTRGALVPLAAGFLPLFLWEAFSLFYYGFPFPNTAYAKLSAGIPDLALAIQGFRYYADSLTRDPITLVMILAGLAAAFGFGEQKEKYIASGVVLYLAYIVKIGGDFMSGRFFAAPLLVSVFLLVRRLENPGPLLEKRSHLEATLIVLAVVLGLASLKPTVFSGAGYSDQKISPAGIADERGYYFADTGLIRPDRETRPYRHPWGMEGALLRIMGVRIFVSPSVGFRGFFAGPEVYIVDTNALADPLLARLPAADRVHWRIGHFERIIPPGYLQGRDRGENHIRDPNLSRYYDAIRLIVRGNLWNPDRLKAIWKMNLGDYEPLRMSYLLHGSSPIH